MIRFLRISWNLELKETKDACRFAAKAGQGQNNGLFRKGQSGNPAGRRPGSRNHATLAAGVLLEGEAEALTRKAIELALEGDTAALKLCLERIVPRRRSRTLSFDHPRIDKASDLSQAIGFIFADVAGGKLRLDEGATLLGMLEARRRAVETVELERRLRALETSSPGRAE